MINPYFVLIALAIDAFGAIIYARQTWRGQAEPDLVSWTIWAVVPFLAFATDLQQGVGIESLITFSAGAGPLLVVVVALVSNRPPWKMHPLDWLCASIAVVGVLLWLFSRNPVFGLWAFIGAQLASATPTRVQGVARAVHRERYYLRGQRDHFGIRHLLFGRADLGHSWVPLGGDVHHRADRLLGHQPDRAEVAG